MTEGFVTNQDKLEFKQIVLQHLKDILKLSQVEFRGGYINATRTPYGNGQFYTQEEYIPDSREVYYNAVISLSDILQPYFDDKIKPKYNEYMKILDMTNMECLKAYEKEFDEIYGKEEESGDLRNIFVSIKKLRVAKLLFRELNLLLHRIDYLKSSVFGEGEGIEEDIVEVDK